MYAADIVDEARTWRGTPWQHQGRVKGVGCDCGGLLVGVGQALGIQLVDHRGYGPIPHGFQFEAILRRHLIARRRADAAPGDVVLMRWLSEPMHTAIDCGATFIHAWHSVGRVVETPWDDAWRDRITHRFSVPGLMP